MRLRSESWPQSKPETTVTTILWLVFARSLPQPTLARLGSRTRETDRRLYMVGQGHDPTKLPRSLATGFNAGTPTLPGSWMGTVINLQHMLERELGVTLGGGKALVTEHLLYGA